jgi:uncharacterized protein (DUF305 family)
MESILEKWGHRPGEPGRQAMGWMGMSTPLEEMPGMAAEQDVRRFRDLTGIEADEAFLRLMNEHHRGGVHMAEHARDHAADPRVVDLAERMAANQSAEMNEYRRAAERLGIEL